MSEDDVSNRLETRRRLEALGRRLAQVEAQLESLEGEDLAGLEDRLGNRLAPLAERLEQLEARLEAVDESFVRHQAQNEGDFRRAEQTVDRVGSELNHHLDAHWRSR